MPNLDTVNGKPKPRYPTSATVPSTRNAVHTGQPWSCRVAAKRTTQIHLTASKPLRERSSFRRAWETPRILLRPRPGFYIMRLRRDTPLVSALIYQLCPMVIPLPTTVDGPNPEEWCRPLDRSPRYGALIDGKRVAIDRVWTTRSLRPVGPEEYAFRMGPRHRDSVLFPANFRAYAAVCRRD